MFVFSQKEFVAFGNNCDHNMANVLLNLNHSSRRLLQQINENQWGEALISEALTRSRSEGFLWCLALDGVIKDLRQLGVLSDTAVLLAEVQSLASLEEKECQTLNTLLSHVDGIYELKVITDQFIALMRQDIDERGKLLTCAFVLLVSELLNLLQPGFVSYHEVNYLNLLEPCRGILTRGRF